MIHFHMLFLDGVYASDRGRGEIVAPVSSEKADFSTDT